MRAILRISYTLVQRALIQPETITFEPFEQKFRVVSNSFEFVIARKPPSDLLYVHDTSTPAAVLKKSAIHILPETLPQLNKREKLAAVTRQLQSNYEKAYRKCQNTKQIFHMQRKIRHEIRLKLSFIGCLTGKYKHLLTFRSMTDLAAERTQKQYEKNGVLVEKLNDKIYPSGHVWMPTNQRYLNDYCKIISSITAGQSVSMLDIGCGSGILSFLFAKANKNSKIFALDKNQDAVRTCNVNAARLELRNIEAFQFDVKDEKEFQIKTLEVKMPKQFDCIVINPPWLAASRLQGDSGIGDGVYDEKGLMLQNSIRLAKRLLNKEGRIVVIFSDLSNLIGLTTKTLEDICIENELIVQSKYEQPFLQQMARKTALQQFKSKARILTYVLR